MNPTNTSMDSLPVELRRGILSHLPQEAIQSMRLTSKLWADIGAAYLLPSTFNLYRNRPSYRYLHSISQHEQLCHSTQRVVFHMADINEYHARHNSYFVQYMRDSSGREEAMIALWSLYQQWKADIEKHVADYCSLGLLRDTIPRLTALQEIEVRLTECPFDDPMWERVWNIESTRRLLGTPSKQHFMDILFSAAIMKGQLRSLSHDSMHPSFWPDAEAALGSISGAFQGLRHLKLISACTRRQNDQPLQSNELTSLGRCLQEAKKLESLYLGFEAGTKPLILLEDSFSADFSWPHLHTLVLECVSVEEEDLAAFLLRHSASLERFRLDKMGIQEYRKTGGDIIASGTLKGLLTRLRGLKVLKKLNLRPLAVPLYDEQWNLIPLVPKWPVMLEEDQNDNDVAYTLERFTIDGAEWPPAVSELTN
jgi:hypothetical protein